MNGRHHRPQGPQRTQCYHAMNNFPTSWMRPRYVGQNMAEKHRQLVGRETKPAQTPSAVRVSVSRGK